MDFRLSAHDDTLVLTMLREMQLHGEFQVGHLPSPPRDMGDDAGELLIERIGMPFRGHPAAMAQRAALRLDGLEALQQGVLVQIALRAERRELAGLPAAGAAAHGQKEDEEVYKRTRSGIFKSGFSVVAAWLASSSRDRWASFLASVLGSRSWLRLASSIAKRRRPRSGSRGAATRTSSAPASSASRTKSTNCTMSSSPFPSWGSGGWTGRE